MSVLTTIAWVSSPEHYDTLSRSLTGIQAGTVAYLGIMEATMAHNGGKHAWDITAAEAQDAAYVGLAIHSKATTACANFHSSGSTWQP